MTVTCLLIYITDNLTLKMTIILYDYNYIVLLSFLESEYLVGVFWKMVACFKKGSRDWNYLEITCIHDDLIDSVMLNLKFESFHSLV